MSDTLQGILARVEAATGPDRDLDADLWWLFSHRAALREFNRSAFGLPRELPAQLPIPGGLGRVAVVTGAPSYTASIDAALALVERVLPGRSWGVRRSGFGNPADAELWNPLRSPGAANSWRASSRTGSAPLAILAALLKALLAGQSADSVGDAAPDAGQASGRHT